MHIFTGRTQGNQVRRFVGSNPEIYGITHGKKEIYRNDASVYIRQAQRYDE